jgi:ribosomal protein S18 acetylase RimI-like enzyme
MFTTQEITTTHRHYSYVEQLLHSAFPENERRDDAQQRKLTDAQGKFRCALIQTQYKEPAGVITYWKFADFTYIEHFAIHPDHRSQGHGTQLLAGLLKEWKHPIVLEAEIPALVGDLAYRRIRFYKRLGFRICRMPYWQPPYRYGDGWLSMKLLMLGNEPPRRIVDEIHWEVYGVKNSRLMKR